MALLYALSSAAVTFASFGAVHLGMRATSTAMQILAGAGLLSLPLALLIARKLATPIFDQNAIAQRDRFHFHAVWMSFWMLGILIGLLPLFVSA